MNIITKEQYLFFVQTKLPYTGYVLDVGYISTVPTMRQTFSPPHVPFYVPQGTMFYTSVNTQRITPLIPIDSSETAHSALNEVMQEAASEIDPTTSQWIGKLSDKIEKMQESLTKKISDEGIKASKEQKETEDKLAKEKLKGDKEFAKAKLKADKENSKLECTT